MEKDLVIDEWQLALKAKKQELQDCQNSNNIKSCLKCQKILECNLRKEYVKAVYESMSKGSGGGFEF
jgi:hypothetical protein